MYILFLKSTKLKIENQLITILGFPSDSVGKEFPLNSLDTGDAGSIPLSGRSPWRSNGNPIKYSLLGIPVDRGAW